MVHLFFGGGVRLFTAGIKQVVQPEFTAKILKVKSSDSLFVIRELGFANLAIGAVGLSVIFSPDWIVPAAVAGTIFYGAATTQHLFKSEKNTLEHAAMMPDFFMFLFTRKISPQMRLFRYFR